MPIARSFDELAQQIRTSRPSIVAIDGWHGAGKSSLAIGLSRHLGIRCVHLDEFLIPRQDRFVESLNFSDLSAALCDRPVLVEGVCLLAVMERMKLTVDMLICVESPEPNPKTAHGSGSLAKEVRAYRNKFQPSDRANVVFAWPDTDEEPFSMAASRSDVDIAYLQSKTKLAVTLAIGGMATLAVGLVILVYGVSGQDHTFLKVRDVEISASGLGAVIMTTSAFWAFFAYKCRPQYSQIQRTSETYNLDGSVSERHHFASSTQAAVDGGATRRDRTTEGPQGSPGDQAKRHGGSDQAKAGRQAGQALRPWQGDAAG